MTTTCDKLIRFFDRAMAFSFYAFIFFLPIANALVETWTVLALLCYFAKRGLMFAQRLRQEPPAGARSLAVLFLRTFQPPANPLNKPIACWLAVCLFSVLISERPALSFDAFLGKVLQYAFLFFNFTEAIRTRRRVDNFMTAFLISIFLVCLSGYNQYFSGMDFIRYNVMEHNRINASFRAANDFAAYLVIVIPVLLSYLMIKAPGPSAGGKRSLAQRKLLILAIALLALTCLGLTYSRGGWLAFSVSLVMFACLQRAHVKKILLGIAVFLGFFTVRMLRERHHMAFQHLFASFGRTTYWSEALKIIAAKPVFGFGLNTYSIVGRRFKEGWGGYPHNCYLQMTAELGIVGLASFVWILVALYRSVLAGLKRMADPELRLILRGSLAGFTGFLIHSAFDTFFYSVQLGSLMWVMMGLLLRLTDIEDA